MHLGPGDRWGVVTWRTKPSTLNHAAFYSANLSSENFFTIQYLHSWRLSIEKLKIRSLSEKMLERKDNWMWLELLFNSLIFHYLFLLQVRKQLLFSHHEIWKVFLNEISWNPQLPSFINLKQVEPLCRLCSVLFQLDWLKSLCRTQRCGLADELMLSLKAFSSSTWPRKCTHLWVWK